MDNLVFKQEINAIKERASSSSYEGLEAIIKAIEKAKSRLHANVNFDLTMELLFLTIRRIKNGKNYWSPVPECGKGVLL